MFRYNLGVAKSYRPVERDQQFLLPPDMRDWLPVGHAVWVLLDAVRLLDTSGFHARCRTGGVGRAGYDPDMMLALLFYAYSRGIRSSRRIERLCWEDVGFRVICAQDVPDHSTIWRFADASPELVRELFVEVLVLCAKAGMGQLETITLDGMKIGANASAKANRPEDHIRAELAKIAAAAVAEHQAADEAENTLFGGGRGDELPDRLADPRSRESRLRQALSELEAERMAAQAELEAKAQDYLARQKQTPSAGATPTDARVPAGVLRLARARANQQAKIDDWERRNAEKIARTGRGLTGEAPQPVEEHSSVIRARRALAKAEEGQAKREAEAAAPKVRNITDPDSRLMPTKSGFVQGYNPQNVVTADHLILATELTQDTGDVQHAIPMMTAAEEAADIITALHSELADAEGATCTCMPVEEPCDDDIDFDQHLEAAQAQPTTKPVLPACPVHPNGIGIIVMDAGYLSEANLTAPGPDRLIATGKRRDVEEAARTNPADPSPDGADDPDNPKGPDSPENQGGPIEQMAQRLRTPDGIAIYRTRGHIAETPHGHIKHNMGIRTLTRRGQRRAAAEWTLICATYNINRLIRTVTHMQNPLPAT